jgi:Short C-terminal domain
MSPEETSPGSREEITAGGPVRRRRLPLVLVLVASVLAFLVIFALWANRQLLDTDNWTETSSELLENDDVREQVSIFLVDQLYANVDVQARLEEALPPRADALAGPAANGLRDLAQRGIDGLLERPRAQELWEQANRLAHQRLLDAVEDDDDEVVSTAGGDVTLDLKALLGQTQDRLGVGGRAEERIPEDAAQVTILHSDELELGQDVVRYLKAIAFVLVVLALGLFALAVYLARGRRRETLRACGIGLVAAGAAVLVVRSLAGDAVVDAVATTEAVRPAAEATWSISTSLLVEAASAAILYGVIVVLAAWIAGPTSWAVGFRRALAPYLREPRYAYGALTVMVLLLLAWGPTPATRRFLPALLLIGLLVAGVEALRRQTMREHPEASLEESGRRMRERLSAVGGRVRGGPARLRREGADGRLDELERIATLRDSGVLDASEFEREKARILGTTPAAPGRLT